ncbi:MAG: class I SAM-dependent methyltransferase [Halioglobus sp.]
MDGDQVLEIGPGAGALLYELSLQGFQCNALEQSLEAVSQAGELFAGCEGNLRFTSEPGDDWENRFDLAISLEVLEHIEDDEVHLRTWCSWLKPEGTLILSVPSRMSKWCATDEWAGHFRRYEKLELEELFLKCGLEIEFVCSYGYPLANLIAPISSFNHQKIMRREDIDGDALEKKSATERSGTDRPLESKLFLLMDNIVAVPIMKFFLWIQKKFLKSDLGDGYVVQAKRVD